ncbi:MAG: polyprenyl synthetase family protein [Leptospira sp.]|nr:polyprenyl synthetase family protein [Leptospira sp.]NCS95559.1 polyprenyl synthetase family protein [Leptospira sp.]
MNISLAVSKIDSTLNEIIHEDLKILKDIKKYVIKSGGKRIRPLTHLLFCDLLNYKGKDQWIVGTIAELIHAASLLHDDVVDEADTRRGKKTVGVLYGNKTAILTGDFLLACGIERLNRLQNPAILDVFTDVIRQLSVSELLQMQWQKNPKITFEIYEKIIYGKTSSLFGAVTQTAALLAGQSSKQAEDYRDFGLLMGDVFQKRDDLLDYFTLTKNSGKDHLKDFSNKLYTYPILVLREKASKQDKALIPKIIESSNNKKIMELLTEYKIKEICFTELNEDIHELREFLTQFPESKSKLILNEQLSKLLY